jgi:hypothetical protein
MSETYHGVPGTFIRGADGALYFVPDSELESYRVPESGRAALEEFLGAHKQPERGGQAHPRSLEATHVHVPGPTAVLGGTRGFAAGPRAAAPPQEGPAPEE